MHLIEPANNHSFRLVWQVASDAMALSDPDGIVLAVNPAYCALYGYAPEDLIGHGFAVIFPPEQRAWARDQYRKIFRSPDTQSAVETAVRRSDGSQRVVESRYTFIEEGGRRVAMLSIIRDITDRKQAEEARADLARLEGATLTARELAHRLNNTLAIAVGNLDLLAESPDLPPAQRARAETILQALDSVARDILAFQKIVRVQPRSTPVGDALDLDRSTG